MPKNRICPILAGTYGSETEIKAVNKDPSELTEADKIIINASKELTHCMGERCAWWHVMTGKCALVAVADEVDQLL